jgi:hypothetical protein
VLVLEVLICKFCAVDALAAGSVVVGEVASLKHEAWDHAVKAGALVSAKVYWKAARSPTAAAHPNPISPVQRASKSAQIK